MDTHSTWLFELVTLTPTVGSHQDTFGYMCGYVILQGTRSVPRFLQQQTRSYLPSLYPSTAHPIIWRAHFPSDVVRNLITWDNPQGKFIKSDLELTTSVLHHDCIAYFSDVLKKKNLSQANNISCMWWQQKVSDTCMLPHDHILQLQVLHQRYHHYIPRHVFFSITNNGIFDLPYQSVHIINNQLFFHLNTYPQKLPWCMWTPLSASVSIILSVLQQMTYMKGFLQAESSSRMATGQTCPNFVGWWP